MYMCMYLVYFTSHSNKFSLYFCYDKMYLTTNFVIIASHRKYNWNNLIRKVLSRWHVCIEGLSEEQFNNVTYHFWDIHGVRHPGPFLLLHLVPHPPTLLDGSIQITNVQLHTTNLQQRRKQIIKYSIHKLINNPKT